MKDKLPVVGKRYKPKGWTSNTLIYKCGLKENNGDPYYILKCELDPKMNLSFSRHEILYGDFWKLYEELPDSNPQEEDCPFETAAEEWNTTKVKEVSEVDRALEELKTILMKATLSNVYYHEQYKEMKELAEKLVKALENLKDKIQ